MTAVNLPTTVSVGATATTVTITGHFDEIHAVNLGTQHVYARTDGSAAVVAADLNYCVPAGANFYVDLDTVPSGGALASDDGTPVTVLSMISTSGSTLVHLCSCDCAD